MLLLPKLPFHTATLLFPLLSRPFLQQSFIQFYLFLGFEKFLRSQFKFFSEGVLFVGEAEFKSDLCGIEILVTGDKFVFL